MPQNKVTTLGPAPIRLATRDDATGPSVVAIGAAVAITTAMVVFLMFI